MENKKCDTLLNYTDELIYSVRVHLIGKSTLSFSIQLFCIFNIVLAPPNCERLFSDKTDKTHLEGLNFFLLIKTNLQQPIIDCNKLIIK